MANVHPYMIGPARVQRTPAKVETSARIALIGGFKPTKCGIATFTTDVYEQMRALLPQHSIDVYAMVGSSTIPTEPGVAANIVREDFASYKTAAMQINKSGADVVWIQHEFGIYGGDCGQLVLGFINAIAAPVIVTLHTVLESPSAQQRAVIDQMREKVSRFVVMSSAGRNTLISTYGINPLHIHVVEHGAPDRPFVTTRDARDAIGLAQRPTIMTFGLLGPGKGLEIAIQAMPEILRQHPDVIYRIVGATHPNLVASEGEAYRDGLKALAAELGVDRSIEWVEQFLETEDLLAQLAGCDIYLTPYLNLAQSTSGTLAYAVALGCAVVSTPYVHAREILGDGVGVLVEPNDPRGIASAVNDLLSDEAKLVSLRARSYARGRDTIWSQFVARCGAIVSEVLPLTGSERAMTKPVMPSTEAFLTLVDDVGIMQHSMGVVPDRHHGYCIDDNARALILVNQLGRETQHLALRFAAFLQHGWNEDARCFRNFMGYDRRWLEAAGSEDSNGRAIWAIGHTAQYASDIRLRDWATSLFNKSAPHLMEIKSPRAMAFFVLGSQHMLARDKSNACARRMIDACGERFAALPLFGTDESAGWCWFEDVLTYDNARIPQALFALATATGDEKFALAGVSLLSWLCRLHTTSKGFFRPVGSEGFGLNREYRPFDQQPLESWAMIDACSAAMATKPSDDWRVMAQRAYGWYLQRNDRGIAIGDVSTGSCYDGLMAQGASANTGAESVLSFSLAYQSLMRFAGGQASYAESVIYPNTKSRTH
jgi:glycosyltransferase involved in cell wall biosynthesis